MPDRRLNPRNQAGRRSGRKLEPVDVPEDPVPDRSLDQLIGVHEHRLRRLERECQQARDAWRDARSELRQRKERWRGALADAHRYWQEARADFFKMAITSGKLRRAKTSFEKLKLEAAQMRLTAVEAAVQCRQAGQSFFDAQRCTARERVHIEKLKIVRDELRQCEVAA